MENELDPIMNVYAAATLEEDSTEETVEVDVTLNLADGETQDTELAVEDKEKPQLSPRRNTGLVKTQRKYGIEDFSEGSYVVYPTLGVGKFEGLEEINVMGHALSILKISFSEDRLQVRLPVQKIQNTGLRPVSTGAEIETALSALHRKKKRGGRKMWSRRAQEYEAKINSGDPVAVAEVVRDLFRCSSAAEQSFSERQLYKSALERFCRELAAVRSIDEDAAVKHVEEILEYAAA